MSRKLLYHNSLRNRAKMPVSLRIPDSVLESTRPYRKSPDGFRAIRASHGARAVEAARALARGNGGCSSRWIGPPSFRVGKGTLPRQEGRTESVPEAGGTGGEAVATPTPPSAGHGADSAANPAASTGGDR